MSWAAVLGAPLSIALLILRYGVNVPVQDQIRIGAFLVRNHGRLLPTFADLFAQHNESRKFFPRLIFFYLAKATGWNVKYEMGVTFVIALCTLVALSLLARRTGIAFPAVAIAALLLFSPVQWWNWLFGIQVVVFLPVLMLVAGLLVATSDRPLRTRALVGAVCCVVATYSYANGMLTWFLIGPVLFSRREDRQPRMIALWSTLAATAIALYFFDYHRPVNSPSMLATIDRPVDLARFALAFLGHPLASSLAPRPNVLLGAIAIAAFVPLSAKAGKAGVAWIALGMYAILSASIAALGRLGMGADLAVEPRYTTFALSLWIAIVMLGAMVTRRSRVAGAVLLVVLHALAIRFSMTGLRENYRDRLLSRAAMQFALVLDDKSLVHRLLETDVNLALNVIDGLNRIGYVRPPLVTSNDIRPLNAGPAAGAFEGVLRLGDGRRAFYGWAKLPDGRAADAVLIVSGTKVVALSERTVFRSDRPGMGWDLPLTARFAVPGLTYTAWAYDTSTRRAYALPGFVATQKR